jgi:hypothetical protein
MDTYSYVLPNIQQPAAERMDAMGWAERLWVRTPNPEGLLLNVIQDPGSLCGVTTCGGSFSGQSGAKSSPCPMRTGLCRILDMDLREHIRLLKNSFTSSSDAYLAAESAVFGRFELG